MSNRILEEDLIINKNQNNQSLSGFLASSLTRAPLSGAQQQYQSRTFNIKLAVNPLVATVAPLLTLVSQLTEQTRAPNYKKLHDSICHEIKVFENKATAAGYRSQIILGARYLICALIDETILTAAWTRDGKWKEYSLLNTFQRESWGGERFFIILERSAEEPSLYIDLLELGYLCLSLGFQGKYRQNNQIHKLALFIDNLYDVIRLQRGEISKRLLVSTQKISPIKPRRFWLPPLWLTIAITTGILIAIFLPYYEKLDKLCTPIEKNIIQLR